jgi:hypothetical protein
MSMITFSKSVLAFGFGLVLLPGCPLVDIEADVPEVCLSYPNLQIPAQKGLTSLKQSFAFDDLSKVHDLAQLDAKLEFVRAEVRVTGGVESLAFIEAVHIVVSSGDPGTTLPPMTMYDCDGNCVPDGAKLEVPAALGNDAIDYLRSDSIIIDLDFRGQIPPTDWTMDVDVCMKARAGYTLSP